MEHSTDLHTHVLTDANYSILVGVEQRLTVWVCATHHLQGRANPLHITVTILASAKTHFASFHRAPNSRKLTHHHLLGLPSLHNFCSCNWYQLVQFQSCALEGSNPQQGKFRPFLCIAYRAAYLIWPEAAEACGPCAASPFESGAERWAKHSPSGKENRLGWTTCTACSAYT